MLAGLLALIEAHRATAAEGPAAVVLRVLGEVAALALRFTAAPGAWRLASVDAPAAGLALVPVDGAPRPAAPPARPRLTPAHQSLVNSAEEALIALARAQQGAHCLSLDIEGLPANYYNRGSMLEVGEDMRHELACLSGFLCEAARELTGTSANATPMEHAIALHDLARITACDPRIHDITDARDARSAIERFTRTSCD